MVCNPFVHLSNIFTTSLVAVYFEGGVGGDTVLYRFVLGVFEDISGTFYASLFMGNSGVGDSRSGSMGVLIKMQNMIRWKRRDF